MRRAILSLAMAVLVQGCSDQENWPIAPEPPPGNSNVDPIAEFIKSEGLVDPQTVHIVLDLPGSDITIFMLRWGHRSDELRWESAYGLRHGDRIGWLFPGYVDPTRYTMYDPIESEEALFTQATWDAVDAADTWIYWQPYLVMLAKDPDVPESALLAIANQLVDYIAPWIANKLMDNPRVQRSSEILTVLATLPHYEAYTQIRARANELLDALANSRHESRTQAVTSDL